MLHGGLFQLELMGWFADEMVYFRTNADADPDRAKSRHPRWAHRAAHLRGIVLAGRELGRGSGRD
ncbi:hypothetical protein D3C81_1320650 [compost metagenome]